MSQAVFIGINQERAIEAAVCAESLAAAKAMLPGLEVIKMTSKTQLFANHPSMSANKKVMMSGATKRPKASFAMPTAMVSVVAGKIEFVATVYVNDAPARDLMYVQFATRPGNPSQFVVCK